jgi:peptidoglycan/xylan/chitin deacetylase (PgdA/CDA1 family)
MGSIASVRKVRPPAVWLALTALAGPACEEPAASSPVDGPTSTGGITGGLGGALPAGAGSVGVGSGGLPGGAGNSPLPGTAGGANVGSGSSGGSASVAGTNAGGRPSSGGSSSVAGSSGAVDEAGRAGNVNTGGSPSGGEAGAAGLAGGAAAAGANGGIGGNTGSAGGGGSAGTPGDEPACPSAGFAWPNGAEVAVSLTYDDSLRSQLDNALPVLDRYGLKGTLFLVTGSGELTSQRARYVAAAEVGHELASHSVNHPCSDELPGYTLESIAAELDSSIQTLRALGVVGPLTYAYPCGANTVGQGQSYVPVANQRFVASRGVAGNVANPRTVDLDNTPGIFGSETVTGAELIARVDGARASGGWVIFGFHGIAGDYATTPQASHDALVEYLASNGATVWTATFGEIARWVAACR